MLEAELLPGRAVVLPDMTEDELKKHLKEEVDGWGKVFEPLRKRLYGDEAERQ